MDDSTGNPVNEERRALMALVGRFDLSVLSEAVAAAAIDLAHEPLRGPESGLVTMRGRIGGGGAPFNLGECTVTRASVRVPGGQVGHSYALGRDRKKALVAATLDALLQHPESRAAVRAGIIEPLAAQARDEDAQLAGETAATRVDFFTLVRGEDE